MDSNEDLFAGPPSSPPPGLPARSEAFAQTPASPGPIRHVGGYGPFVGYCVAHGTDAGLLARDVDGLIGFLRAHGRVLAADPVLRNGAAVFAANSIVALRPDARWLAMHEGSPMAGNEESYFETAALVDQLPDAPREAFEGLLGHLHAWALEPVDETPELEVPALADRVEPAYARPALNEPRYLDAAGEPIAYGRRWEPGDAPEESYEAVSHPERFAGLHVVADALIGHLRASYDVRAAPADPAGLDGIDPEHVLRSVRLEPAGGTGAPLEIIFRDFPSVMVRAGVLHSFVFPDCGCDACDETMAGTVEALEDLVLTVAAGGYVERYPSGPKRRSEYALNSIGGSGSEGGSGEPEAMEPEELQAAEARLAALPGGWQAWPLRSSLM